MTPIHLLSLDELDANPWATCGPATVAALLHRPLAAIRDAFPLQRPGRTWTNARQMKAALDHLGVRWAARPYASADTTTAHRLWPEGHGVVLIQFEGPWSSYRVAMQHTHFIGVSPVGTPAERWVFDVNAVDFNGGFMPFAMWEQRVVPMLVQDHRRRTGGWWVRESFGLEGL